MSTAPSTTAGNAELPTRKSGHRIVLFGRLALVLVLLVAWEMAARWLGLLYIAGPVDVARRTWLIAANGELFGHVYATLSVSAIGFALGCSAGIALPFLLRKSLRLTQATEPFLLALMGIPKFALAPLLILWFGIEDKPKIVVVTLMVFFVVFVTVFAGVRSVDQKLVNMARVMGASEIVVSREIVWRSLTPFFFSGLKVALPRALSATIVGEFLVANRGVGYYIEHSRQTADTVGVFTGIAIATALVVAINMVLEHIQKRTLAWRPSDPDMEV